MQTTDGLAVLFLTEKGVASMQYEPFYPISANLPWVLGVFFASLLLFHVLLIWVLEVGAVTWKQIDYVWLAIAALGLLGAVSEVRRMVAQNQLGRQQSILTWAYEDLRREAEFMIGPAVCRQFVRSKYSRPDFDAIQQEYDAACQFARQMLTRLPSDPPPDLQGLRLADRPKVTDPVLQQVFEGLSREVESYLRARRAMDQTIAATKRTPLEDTLALFGPLLLAVALALRMTKVSGEIRMSRQTAKASPSEQPRRFGRH